MITKVMKYELTYLDGAGTFHEMQEAVWGLQRQTREILNKTIQTAFHWDYISREHHEKTGEYLDIVKETGKKDTRGYAYAVIHGLFKDMGSHCINTAIQVAWKKYKDSRIDVLKGDMSLPTYRKNQPIYIDNQSIKLNVNDIGAIVDLTLFSASYKKAHGLKGNVQFKVRLHDKTQQTIFQRLLSGEYKLGQSQLSYEKKKWFLSLTYSFEKQTHTLDPDKILGVDLGSVVAIYASSMGEFGSLKISGGDIAKRAAKIEERIRFLQEQATYCGEGRIGHGTKTRVAPAYQARDTISGYRDAMNHQMSRTLVEYAYKNGYGTIQMEDLKGIKDHSDFPKKLRHWTYFDLQTKIIYKAAEYGIQVIKVNPRFTSQRCSRCGHIEEANRKDQAHFHCRSCGYQCNADFNASQNLSMKGIDALIAKAIAAKSDHP